MSFTETAVPLLADSSAMCFEAAAAVTAPSGTLHLHPESDPGRGDACRLITEVYARQYGARLTCFMPRLVSLQLNGRICAAAGYRSARERLFLERYLPQPIEQVLASATGRRIRRQEIVEVGQFVSARPGLGRRLMVALGHHLAEAGFNWAVLTATAEVRLLLRRMGLKPLKLIDADPARLGADAAAWGSYYAHAPKVLAGDLASAVARFDRRTVA
jgi:hypothetical protein